MHWFFSCNFFAEEEEQVSAVWIDSLSSLRKSCSWTKSGSTTSQCQLTLTGRADHVLFNNRNGHGAPSCFEVQFFLLICDSQKNKPIILSYVGENVSARNLLVHIHVQFDKPRTCYACILVTVLTRRGSDNVSTWSEIIQPCVWWYVSLCSEERLLPRMVLPTYIDSAITMIIFCHVPSQKIM